MASKLIVNEIEHTDGSGTAVTMAKATIADATLTTGTLGSGVTGGAGLSGSTSLGTVTVGNLSNTNIVFPAGHVVKQSIWSDAVTTSITSSTSSYVDTGIEVAHTTALSSADSYLVYDFYHGMGNVTANGTVGYVNITMRTASNSTYESGEGLITGNYPTFFYTTSGGDTYWTIFMRIFCGLETDMPMPATKTSWAAGDTLYFRMFIKNSGSGNFVLYGASSANVTVKEVVR